MAGNNNFKVFNESQTNIMDDAAYDASTYRQNGAVAGIAPSNLHNKLYRQTSIMAAAIAQSLANRGYDVSDANFNSLVSVLDHIMTEIADNSVTDAKIGNRTVNDSTTPVYTGSLTALMSGIFNMVKSITGKADGKTAPAITLEALNTLIATTAAAGKLLKLDGSGLLPTGITGNAATASKLATARTIALTGDVTGTGSFDGSGNLSIAATVMAGMPLGFTFSILANTPPDGCLALQGALVSRTAYPELWAWVQAHAPLITEAAWQAQAAVQSSVGAYSSGDGSTNFRLPKIADFVRGGAPGAAGTWQDNMLKAHTHAVRMRSFGNGGGSLYVLDGGVAPVPGATLADTGGEETRPNTIVMLWCVKAFGAAVNQGIVDITELANSIAGKQKQIKLIVLKDIQTSGVSGGTFTTGGWRQRTINTIATDQTGQVSLAASQFSLPAGTYEVHAYVPALRVRQHKSRLQNITDGTTILLGASTDSDVTDWTQSSSDIIGAFTLVATKTLAIEHYGLSTAADTGFGIATAIAGINETYTTVHLRKVD